MCWCVVVLFCCVTVLLCCCVFGLSFCCFVVVVLFCCAVVVLFCHSGLPTVGCGCVLQLRDLQPNLHRYGLLNCGQVNPYPNNTGGIRQHCPTKGGIRIKGKKNEESWCLTWAEAQNRIHNHVWFSSVHKDEPVAKKQRLMQSFKGLKTQLHYSDGRIGELTPYIPPKPFFRPVGKKTVGTRPKRERSPSGERQQILESQPIGMEPKRERSPSAERQEILESSSSSTLPGGSREKPWSPRMPRGSIANFSGVQPPHVAEKIEQWNGGRSKWSEFEP